MGKNWETLLTKCLSLDIELEHSFKEFYVSPLAMMFIPSDRAKHQ